MKEFKKAVALKIVELTKTTSGCENIPAGIKILLGENFSNYLVDGMKISFLDFKENDFALTEKQIKIISIFFLENINYEIDNIVSELQYA